GGEKIVRRRDVCGAHRPHRRSVDPGQKGRTCLRIDGDNTRYIQDTIADHEAQRLGLTTQAIPAVVRPWGVLLQREAATATVNTVIDAVVPPAARQPFHTLDWSTEQRAGDRCRAGDTRVNGRHEIPPRRSRPRSGSGPAPGHSRSVSPRAGYAGRPLE